MAQISIIKKSELEGATRLDAEYYQPKYFALVDKIKQSGLTIEMLGDLTTEKVHRGVLPEYTGTPEIPVLKTVNVRNDFIFLDGCSYTTQDFYDKNSRGVVKPHDIVMTSTGRGTLGRVNVFNEDCKAFADGHIAIVRTDKIDPYYMYVFLISKYGQFQTERAYTGSTGQIEIYPDHIEKFLVAVPDNQHQKSIRELVSEAHSLKRQSETLYLKAEQLLLEEIGFKYLDLSHQLYYTVPYRKATEVSRLDAEHFQPKYEWLLQHLANTGKADLLGNLVAQPIKRGLQPEYDSNGGAFAFTEKDLGRYLLNVEEAQHISEDFWRRTERGRVRKGDILLYSIGAYIGRANVYLENAKAVASSNLTIIRTDKAKCNSVYLALYLNSPLGQLQAEKWTASVGQMALYPSDVPKFVVYLPSMEFQQRIADVLTQSWEVRQKARQLLEEAKRKVEDLIEGKRIKGVGW